MQLTVTTMGDLVFTLDVNEEMELENLVVLCSLESNIAQESLVIVFNGVVLTDQKKSIGQYGIKNGDMVLARESVPTPTNSGPSSSSGGVSPTSASSHAFKIEEIYNTLKSNPEQVELLRMNNPRLAEAFDKSFEEFSRVIGEQQEAKVKEEQRRLRMLMSDPFDSEAQHMIAEEIRRQQIESNMETAMEYMPESFAEVSMLYIDCKVNGFHIKAFVDSGAQSTIMSKACAERCNILRLIDTRWGGIARGVGTQKILGKIHLVQLEINGVYVPCSFIILEHQPMDMLLGLDMLRRYQCSIDLKHNLLQIGTTNTSTPFLSEREIPKFDNADLPLNAHSPSSASALANSSSSKTGHVMHFQF